MTSLYELDGELAEIMSMIDSGDLALDDASDQLEAMNGEFELKAENIGRVLANMKAKEDALKAEAERIKSRIEKVSTDASWLRNHLLTSMQKRGVKKVDTNLFTFSYRKPTKKVVIDDEGLLPPEVLVEVPAPYKVDKKAVKALLEGVDSHPAAHLEDGQINLTIK